MIDLSNNINSLRREYNTMTHKELDSIYINTNSNIFSVDTSFREQVGIDVQKGRFVQVHDSSQVIFRLI